MSSMVKPRETGAFFKSPREFVKRGPNGFPIGPRTKRRQKENRQLNKLPDHIKKQCEIRLSGCLKNKYLSWAHSKKSRFITTDKDWQEAARSCAVCHDALDHRMGHAEMARRVKAAIAARRLDA